MCAIQQRKDQFCVQFRSSIIQIGSCRDYRSNSLLFFARRLTLDIDCAALFAPWFIRGWLVDGWLGAVVPRGSMLLCTIKCSITVMQLIKFPL